MENCSQCSPNCYGAGWGNTRSSTLAKLCLGASPPTAWAKTQFAPKWLGEHSSENLQAEHRHLFPQPSWTHLWKHCLSRFARLRTNGFPWAPIAIPDYGTFFPMFPNCFRAGWGRTKRSSTLAKFGLSASPPTAFLLLKWRVSKNEPQRHFQKGRGRR